MKNPYLRSKVLTADPGQVLIMLYDGALRFCRQAIQAYDKGEPLKALPSLRRMLDIVQELQLSLNPQQAPELCANLTGLYNWVQDQVLTAQREQSSQGLREVVPIMTELKETWQEAVTQLQGSQAAAG